MDRTIHFGDDEADARYRIQDTSSTGGDFVLAEDLDGGTVLLEYDYSASEWVSRGPVNLNGNDITDAGSVSADTLEANTADTRNGYNDVTGSRSFDTVETNNTGADLNINVVAECGSDGSAMSIVVSIDGSNVDEESIQNPTNGDKISVSNTVQDGSDYQVKAFGDTANFSLRRWSEQS